MLQIINFKDLSKIKDKNLLKLTNKVYELAEEEQVSELALHYFINEVSKRHYDIDDVNLNKATDEYLCFDNDVFIKVVKTQAMKKFIKYGEVGYCALPITSIRSIQNDDKGNIFFFA